MHRLTLNHYSEAELPIAIASHSTAFYQHGAANSADAAKSQDRILSAVHAGTPLRPVCERPLTLRMLFQVYAPDDVPSSINTFELYDQFWNARKVRDQRHGMIQQ